LQFLPRAQLAEPCSAHLDDQVFSIEVEISCVRTTGDWAIDWRDTTGPPGDARDGDIPASGRTFTWFGPKHSVEAFGQDRRGLRGDDSATLR
jgi:hypothetical protein